MFSYYFNEKGPRMKKVLLMFDWLLTLNKFRCQVNTKSFTETTTIKPN